MIKSAFQLERLRRATARARNHEREAGFTLVEMLVVIAIIGLVVGLVGPRVLNYLSESKVKAAKIQIESFSAALDLYYHDNGSYPDANEGLIALVERPPSALAWNGPYLKTGSVLYSTGADIFGDSYGTTFTVDTLPLIPANAWTTLSDVAPYTFWSPYHN